MQIVYMNWLQKIAVSCQILFNEPSGVHILIDGKSYWFLGDPPVREQLQKLVNKDKKFPGRGWGGRAVQLLNGPAFDILETPEGIKGI